MSPLDHSYSRQLLRLCIWDIPLCPTAGLSEIMYPFLRVLYVHMNFKKRRQDIVFTSLLAISFTGPALAREGIHMPPYDKSYCHSPACCRSILNMEYIVGTGQLNVSKNDHAYSLDMFRSEPGQ